MKTIPEQIFQLGIKRHRAGDPADLDITCAGCASLDCLYCHAVQLAKTLHPCPEGADEQDFYDYHGDDFWETMEEFQNGFQQEIQKEKN